MPSNQITSAVAWELTLLTRAFWRKGTGALQVSPEEQPDLTITVQAGGGWSSDAVVEPEAASLLDMMLPLCALKQDRFVVAQMGQSLDGRIATANGVSHYINGAGGITHLHRLRALVDAVVIGAGTASADNPQLTVRHVRGPNPVRVIIDPNRRVPAQHQVFNDSASPTLRLVSARGDQHLPGVTDAVLGAGESGGALDPRKVLDLLAARGLQRVLVEGGGLTVSGFLEAGVVDRLHLLVAPMIIGSGRPAFTLPPMTTLENALRPKTRVFSLGTDTLFDLQPGVPAP